MDTDAERDLVALPEVQIEALSEGERRGVEDAEPESRLLLEIEAEAQTEALAEAEVLGLCDGETLAEEDAEAFVLCEGPLLW